MLQTNVEKIKTRIVISITFFKHCAFYEIMWKNTLEPERPQITIWRMRIACWIPKATNTLSKYIILIGFPLQQCFSKYLTKLMHKICFTISFISCLYMFRSHVSSSGGQNCITQPLVSSHL